MRNGQFRIEWLVFTYHSQLKVFLKQRSGASDLNNGFKMMSINNRTTSTNGYLLTRATFSCPGGQSIHYEALATTTTNAAITSLISYVTLIKLCRAYSNLLKMPKVGELPWSWILVDRAQVHKEKEKFVLVNYVFYKRPHRKISRHCRAVMAKKFTKKSDAFCKIVILLI